jgi:hypothetical protein
MTRANGLRTGSRSMRRRSMVTRPSRTRPSTEALATPRSASSLTSIPSGTAAQQIERGPLARPQTQTFIEGLISLRGE